jgi:hypothetical protein
MPSILGTLYEPSKRLLLLLYIDATSHGGGLVSLSLNIISNSC